LPAKGLRVERVSADLDGAAREEAARLVEVMDGHVDEQRLLHLELEAVEERHPAKVDPNCLHPPERSASHLGLHRAVAAAEAVVLAGHECPARLVGALDQLPRLADAGRERLLDETMHSGFQRLERQRSVRGWGRDDEHCVGLDLAARRLQGHEPQPLVERHLLADQPKLFGIGVDQGSEVPVRRGLHLGRPARAHAPTPTWIIWQRELLAPHAEVVEVDRSIPPHLLKPLVPRVRPADKMILVDVDVVVLRPLTPLLAETAGVVVFADPVAHRFHSEWAELLDLPPMRPGPYLDSGFFVLNGSVGQSVVDLVAEKQQWIDAASSRYGGSRSSSPFYYVDQDVWNAVLASSVGAAELAVQPADLAPHPPFSVSEGREPPPPPRGPKALARFDRGQRHSRLLPRLLLGPDVALRLEPDQVPLRLRRGLVADAERMRVEAAARAYWLRGRVGLRRRHAERRRRT
jgi:hypothetical protein